MQCYVTSSAIKCINIMVRICSIYRVNTEMYNVTFCTHSVMRTSVILPEKRWNSTKSGCLFHSKCFAFLEQLLFVLSSANAKHHGSGDGAVVFTSVGNYIKMLFVLNSHHCVF